MEDYLKQIKKKHEERDENNSFWIILIVSIVSLLLIGGIVYYVFFAGQYSKWENNSFSIKYPKVWQPVKSIEGAVVSFISPKETALDIFQENLNVAVQDLSENPMLLSEFTQIAIEQLMAVFSNLEIVTNEEFFVSGYPGHRLSFKATGEQDLQVDMIWMIKGELAYTVTYMAMQDRYEEYLPLIEEMFKSFELK